MERLAAAAVLLTAFIAYNANGREIGSYDSQPLKFTAIEFVRHHDLVLDSAVAQAPGLASRPGFARDLRGHFRSAYPPLPGIVAGLLGTALHAVGLFDPDAPLAAPFLAKLTASLLVAGAVACAYGIARRYGSRAVAVGVALGFGLGTNLWAQASQTLWQTDATTLALTASVLLLDVAPDRVTAARRWGASALIGAAVATRPQLALSAAVVAALIAARRRRLSDALALAPLAAILAATLWLNIHWFGTIAGARLRIEAAATAAHQGAGSLGNPLVGAVGLLVSPSRGLVVFSPIVLVCAAAFGRRDQRSPLGWWTVAAAIQFAVYSSYSAWWGGHTYGPRLVLDVLPFLVPAAALGASRIVRRPAGAAVGAAALAWSAALAATGAFVYPNEQWNTDPADVDTHHERLWDWGDPQFIRCWTIGPDSRNFDLFTRDAVRAGSGR